MADSCATDSPWTESLRRLADVFSPRSCLSRLDVLEDGIDVVIELGGVFVSCGPDFSDDRVSLRRLHSQAPLVRWACI